MTLAKLWRVDALASRYHRLRDAFEQFIGSRDIAATRVRESLRGCSPSFEFDSPRAVSPEWRGSYTRRRLAATTQVLTR